MRKKSSFVLVDSFFHSLDSSAIIFQHSLKLRAIQLLSLIEGPIGQRIGQESKLLSQSIALQLIFLHRLMHQTFGIGERRSRHFHRAERSDQTSMTSTFLEQRERRLANATFAGYFFEALLSDVDVLLDLFESVGQFFVGDQLSLMEIEEIPLFVLQLFSNFLLSLEEFLAESRTTSRVRLENRSKAFGETHGNIAASISSRDKE